MLLETDPTTREVLAGALSGLGYTVLTEQGCTGVERTARLFRPDVVLIGVRPRDRIDSLTLARWVRANAGVPVLFLGPTRDTDEVVRAFDAGADDYLVKPFLVSELVARMEAVLRHTRRTTGDAVVVGDLLVDPATHSCTRGGHELQLTQREFALLTMLCRHAGRILTKGQLLAEVWHTAEHFDPNVVEVHVSALRRKLEGSGARMIHTVRGVGYVLRP